MKSSCLSILCVSLLTFPGWGGAAPSRPAETLASSNNVEEPAAAAEENPSEEAGPEEVFDFKENSSLRTVLRVLAKAAGINYVEPEIDAKETISCSIRGMSAWDAFTTVAQQRGFSIKNRGGVILLTRQGLTSRGQLVTKRYVVHNIDVRLIIQSVANSLGIPLRTPSPVSMAFPPPQATGGVGDATGSSMSSSGGASSASSGAGMGGSEMSSSITSSGGGSKSRWIPSLPMDTPLSKGGFDPSLQSAIYQDRAENAIVVRAPEAQQEEIGNYIASLDKVELQVEIETKILEIDVDRAKELGIDWTFTAGNGFGIGTVGSEAGALVGAFGYRSGGTILSTKQVSATLTALERKGLSSTVSWTRSVTRSGVPVCINNSTEQQVELQTTVTNTAGGTALETSMQSYITGVIGDVTPVILSDGRLIDLNINPTVATQVGVTLGASGQEIPKIARRGITTSVLVPDGLTVAVGGVMQVSTDKTHQQTPLVGRIPVVGLLFQHQKAAVRRVNLVILVTPHIIRGSAFRGPDLSREDHTVLDEAGSEVSNIQPQTRVLCAPRKK